MKIRPTLALLLMIAFIITACGGSVEVAENETATPVPEPTATTAPVEQEPETEEEPASAEETTAASAFAIIPALSEARFYIDEVLRGEPKTVEGIAEQVLGSLTIDSLSPLSVELGPVRIKSNSFVTDNNFRNRAISEFILQSDQFPNIVFTPVEVIGLPQSGEPGQTYSFEVAGDLTIREITQPVTFLVTLSADSAEMLTGSASATINRTDFGLTIPSVPQVADVSEEVILEFDFAAERSSP